MTFYAYCLQYLEERGMFPGDADAVASGLGAQLRAERSEAKDLLAEEMEGYPDPLTAVILLRLRSAAIDWIDANQPKAWFRPLFDDSKEN